MTKQQLKQIRNIMAVALLTAILPVLVNHRPVYINYQNEHFFPALSGKDIMRSGEAEINLQITDFKMSGDAFVWMPLIPYSPGRSDLLNSYVGPFDTQYVQTTSGVVDMPLLYRHWLGTDGRGADVLAGLLYGFRYSMGITLLAMIVAAIPGIFLGSAAGYFGNKTVTIPIYKVFALLSAIVYFLCTMASGILIPLLLACVIYIIVKYILKYIPIRFFQRRMFLAVDRLTGLFTEILVSVPSLILIITVAAVLKPDVVTLACILGVLLWPEVVRFTRAQVLQVKEQDYILAAQALGYSGTTIIVNHILRNAIVPVLILLCFASATIILTEASLSYLGVGLPADVITWGSLLASARNNFNAWWLIVFPGAIVTVIVYYLVSLADAYQQQYKLYQNK